MKNILLPLLVTFLIVFTTSCKREIIYQDGPHTTIVQGTDTRINSYYFDVRYDEWRANDNYGYYFCECDFPELTEAVIDRGIVVVYMIDNDGYDNPMPFIKPCYDESTGQYYWENLRYDLSQGKITFIIQDSDFYTGEMSFENLYKFKVCVAIQN